MQLAGRTARKPIRSSDSRFGAIEYAGNGAAAAVAAAVDARGRSAVSGRLGCRTDMIDRVTSERRSEIMRSAGQKGAGAEMKVHRARCLPEYRCRRREPPGKPDIVFPSRRKTAFVHGRFRRRFGRLPKSDEWAPKVAANRDERNAAVRRRMGGRAAIRPARPRRAPHRFSTAPAVSACPPCRSSHDDRFWTSDRRRALLRCRRTEPGVRTGRFRRRGRSRNRSTRRLTSTIFPQRPRVRRSALPDAKAARGWVLAA